MGRIVANSDNRYGLTDRKGKFLPLVCNSSEAELLNPETLILSDKIADFENIAGLDFAVLRLQPGESVRKVLEMYENGVQPESSLNFTRGLYYK
jgi:hypothetical protein